VTPAALPFVSAQTWGSGRCLALASLQPLLDRECERGMASVVGRIRTFPILGVKYALLAHNTIRGAAGASVPNAELLKTEGLLPG